ncbi:hypothetical protein CEXT_320861, partial [Caerostris extrusa]
YALVSSAPGSHLLQIIQSRRWGGGRSGETELLMKREVLNKNECYELKLISG